MTPNTFSYIILTYKQQFVKQKFEKRRLYIKKLNRKRKSNLNIKSILLIVLAIIAVNSLFSGSKSYSKVEVEYKSEYASYGDTLWSIAERESKNNKYYQDKDVREIIYDLKKINNMSNSDLSEGQEIKIPKM